MIGADMGLMTNEDGGHPAWREVVDGPGGLRATMPAEPVERRRTEFTSVGPVGVRGFQAEWGGATFLATCSKIPSQAHNTDYVRLLDAPLDGLVVGGKRRRPLGERLSGLPNPLGPRQDDFALPKRRDGVARIARRRWMERQGHFYQAIAVLPSALDASPVVERFLRSLAAIPIALDRRGLTPAWQRRVADRDHGFAVLWPERLDDFAIRVTSTATGSLHRATYFTFQVSLGVAVAVHDYHPPWLRPRHELRIDPAEMIADVRDRFLAEHDAELLDDRRLVDRHDFTARFRTPTPAGASEMRARPPGLGAARVEARIYPGANRAWLVYATTPDDREHRGAASYLESFERVE